MHIEIKIITVILADRNTVRIIVGGMVLPTIFVSCASVVRRKTVPITGIPPKVELIAENNTGNARQKQIVFGISLHKKAISTNTLVVPIFRTTPKKATRKI